jgi:pimeloyl-ACP methyl ester carboxylesterase
VTRPLSPAEMFPAGHDDISVRFVTLVTQTRVRILECGATGDVDVVMLHGWVASAYSFRHQLANLPANGARCVAVDLRGFGLSDKPPGRGSYTMAGYIADLDALLDALALKHVVLMGHSMGGGIALTYALARPDRVRGLALFAPTGVVPVAFLTLPKLMPRALASMAEGLLIPRWEARWILRSLAYGDASRVTDRDIDEYWAPTQLPGFALAARASAEEFDWRPIGGARLSTIAAPSVVILGKKDRLIRNAAASAQAIPGASVRVLDAGHCAHEERPEEAHELVGSLIRRVRETG